uniref:PBPe domain-containing protein n=1 Tax=Mesocestoides corti TaxID=53468 RepID=A0A5K3F939_MESCO
MYFKSQVELDTIYRTMEGRNVDTVEEGIQAVKSGALKAFIWDSARLNYEASRDCDLVTTGDVFGRTGYGLAMKKGNPWIYELSQAVLNFHERGFMEQLDTQWIFDSAESEECAKMESSPATLELTNMAGVFIMVAVGILAGLFLLLIELVCNRSKSAQAKQTVSSTKKNRWLEASGHDEVTNPFIFMDECTARQQTAASTSSEKASTPGVEYYLPQAVLRSPIRSAAATTSANQQPGRCGNRVAPHTKPHRPKVMASSETSSPPSRSVQTLHV